MAAPRTSFLALLLGFGLLARPSAIGSPAAAAVRWPETIDAGETAFTLHQLQADRYSGDGLEGRAAVTVRRKGEKEPTFGVVFFRARTAESGSLLNLEGIEITKGSFPWERDGGNALLALFRESAPRSATIPLVSVTASPAVAFSLPAAPAPPRTPEPRVISHRGPTVLVLVDGDYVIRPVSGTPVLRVMNTRSLLLQDSATSRFYLPMGSQWLVAPAPNGKWSVARKVPAGFDAVRKAAAAEPGVESYAHPDEAINALLRAGKAPAIVVSTTPAVLASKMAKPATPPPGRERDSLGPARPGDIYAGPDGNAYRPVGAGRWEKTNGRDWYPLQVARGKGIPTASGFDLLSRLDGERRAREAGGR
ncbi:MAG: hypothetical protein ACHQPI_01815 [Thermoanaerobaculia bacterium]